MTKVKIFKSLLPFLILPCLLLNCQALITRADDNNSLPYLLSQQKTKSALSDIQEIRLTYNKFASSINILNQQLQEVAAKQRTSKSVDLKTPYENLKLLRQANENLITKNISKFKYALNNINHNLDDISRVVEPLSNGLTNQNVRQIQNYLNLPEREPSVQRNLGTFGKITQTAIQKFFNEQNQNLTASVQELEKISQGDRTINSHNQPAISETDPWQYNLSVTVPFFAGICLGVLGIFSYQKLSHKSSNKNRKSLTNPQISKPTATPNINSQNHTSKPVTPEPESQPQTKVNTSNSATENPSNIQPASHTRSISKIIHHASVNELIGIYNQNRNSLFKYAIEVSETEESINQRRLGFHQTAVLEKVSKGKGSYWIINKQGIDYLLPKGNIKINEYNYTTVESLFDC